MKLQTISKRFKGISSYLDQNLSLASISILIAVSITFFSIYLQNGIGLFYNDARSHLDIGRRVVEGLKPGLAQIGSVWLPLPHLLMIPTIWNDFMWHTGLSGSLVSMISFVATNLLIFKFLERLKVGRLGKILAMVIFSANLNVLYLQSTAMTELLLIATMMAGSYYLLCWYQDDDVLNLVKSAFWIMMATLVRYDGWFLLFISAVLVFLHTFKKRNYSTAEGTTILFTTLGGFGVALWFLWNLLIFKDPLYFAFGPYSAHAQQEMLSNAGNLATKGNIFFSLKIYSYALLYNSYTLPAVLALLGIWAFYRDPKQTLDSKVASLSLFAPILFNILALYLGHSVLFIQGLSGNTWFNVRYGVMVMPVVAVFLGILIDKAGSLKTTLIGILAFVLFFAFANQDAVTIDDARFGSSQKNVSEVSDWLKANAADKPGFVLISAASHDAIIFSSGMPMSKFIHEGTGIYWEVATIVPEKWARWIIMRTNDNNDQTWAKVSRTKGFGEYIKVGQYPFADIYELRPEYLNGLNTQPVFKNQK